MQETHPKPHTIARTRLGVLDRLENELVSGGTERPTSTVIRFFCSPPRRGRGSTQEIMYKVLLGAKLTRSMEVKDTGHHIETYPVLLENCKSIPKFAFLVCQKSV